MNQSISHLDQKGGRDGNSTGRVMGDGSNAPHPVARHRIPALAAGSTALLVGFLLLAAPSIAGASPSEWTASATSWTNGQVLCLFDSASPAVTVSAAGSNGTGLWSALGAFEEVGAKGVVATANFSLGTWTATNRSTDDFYELSFAGEVPIAVVGSTDPPAPADLQVDYLLPAYTGAGPWPTNEVVLSVGLTNWTWQNPGDSLQLTLPIAPGFPTTEHLVPGGQPGALLSDVSDTTGATLQYLNLTAQASASSPGITPIPLTLGATAVVRPESALVTVAFGMEAGHFQVLNYSTALGVPIPATIAGIPTIDFALVGAAGVVASLAIAAGVRRVRSRPSDLEYVEEAE